MRLCNFRSLLLAAVVLSNCITWTASKHHFTHNVSGHRSRHRRQGSGLYLSASYVIPGGEGTGWGEWGQVSPCSRTCGGGVASQKRICLQVSSDGQPQCTGGDTKYFSCETQDCPEGSQDFRAEQCSEYNNKKIGGGTYRSWEPYMNAPNPCELNCMPHGERFYYRHKTAVVDGTKCNEDSFDVCVQGTCQPVGCDMMLGSNAKEDKCRECRGNDANCYTNSDLIDTQDLIKGYNDILLIPKGATHIRIAEVKASVNYLALRPSNGSFYLNGNYHIDFPRSIFIAGTTWHYERSQQGFPAPDKLSCLGPITEPLYLSLLLQDVNVGIQYEYSLPKSLGPAPTQTYGWVHSEFTPCSASCGGGFQYRNVTCSSSQELKPVEEALCNEALRPVANQTCNLHECPAQWIEGPWSACSKPCGDGGTKSRNVYCQKIITNGFPSVVADKECFDMLGPKPKLFEKCNEDASCPTWFIGSWTPCDKLCDEGKQTRKVVCRQVTGGKVEVFNDTSCMDEKPITEQSCMVQPCKKVDWVISEWTGCDTCLSKNRTRHAECVTEVGVVVNSSFCAYHKAPILEKPCLKEEIPPCEVQWYATQWSPCSVLCGKGIQARRVFCGTFNGTIVITVDDAECANLTKYKDTKPCEIPSDQCPAQWYAGSWPECNKECGTGDQLRKVMCLQNGEASKNCLFVKTMESTQSCNKQPCENATRSDDDLDYCDDDDDEEHSEQGLDILTTISPPIEEMTNDTSTLDEGSGMPDGAELESTFTPDTSNKTGHPDTESTIEDEFLRVPDINSTSLKGNLTDYISEDESTTDGSTTEGSTTDGSTTDGSTTDGSTTDGSTTDGSTTEEIITEESTTEEIITEESTTEAENATMTTADLTSAENLTTTEVPIATSSLSSTEGTKTNDTSTKTPSEETKNDTITTAGSTSAENASTTEGSITAESSNSTDSTTIPSEETKNETTTIAGATSAENLTTTEVPTTAESSDTTEDSNATTTSEESKNDTSTTAGSTSAENATTTESSTTAESSNTTASTTITSEETKNETITTADLTSSENATTTEGSTSAESSNTTESSNITASTTISSEETGNETTTTAGTSSAENITTTEVPTSAESSNTTEDSNTTASTTVSIETNNETTTLAGATSAENITTTEVPSTSSNTTEGSDTTAGNETTTIAGATSAENLTTTEVPTTAESSNTTATAFETGNETTTTGGTSSAENLTTTEVPTTTESSNTAEDSNTTESTTVSVETSNETTSSAESSTTTEVSTTAESLNTTGTSITTENPATAVGTTPWTLTSTLEEVTPRQCKPRPSCNKTRFGCCPDKKTAASGPFDEGCAEKVLTCNETKHGCCPDGVSPAEGPDGEGCPVPPCSDTLYGCCSSDNKTAAEGNDQEGCPPPPPACLSSTFGCCKDGETEATGPEKAGCPESITSTIAPTTIEESCSTSTHGCCYDNITEATGPNAEGCPCNTTQFGCCPDGVSSAQGTDMEGCLDPCKNLTYGCCADGKTPAHGPEQEGCCLSSPFGCCPDNYKPADGPHLEGCECQHAHFGCCPDNATIARGANKEGCGCQYTEHGCCPDRHTEASGPDLEGCDCHTYQFGCCPDGVTVATGPNLQGCHCSTSKYGCCSDGETPARGRNQFGCNCASSMFGCCSDGKTEAKGPKFFGCTEVPINKQAACSLPTDRGSCHNYSVYWYYDVVYGGCSRFWYGGCEGNGNRFDTNEECKDVCVQPPARDVCKLPNVKGACVGYNIRWYYDSARQQCLQFNYGGCLGNANNFDTKELCEKKCEPERTTNLCNLAIESGPCNGTFGRWAFNSDKDRCEQFFWGGCEGNSNRFTSETACLMRCKPPGTSNPRCTMPQVAGNCADTQALWSFSQTENQCVPFYYTGCMGNDNSFNSFQDCTETCPSAYEPNECTLPAATGECGNYREKWYYDTTTKKCSTFYYGGCGGNGNNFNTREDCEGHCFEPEIPEVVEPKTDTCQLPMISGPCDESLMRWFYDPASDSCSQFTYGGCEGNDNRFETRADCEWRCKTGLATTTTSSITIPSATSVDESPEGCQVSSALEQCAGAGEVWYLDPTRSECVSHINSNTGASCRRTGVFNSQEACERSCGVIKLNNECKLLPELGVCQSRYTMWFFDVTTNKCVQFIYSGCGGNNNRFETSKDCMSFCRTNAVIDTTTAATTIIISTTNSSLPITSATSSSTPLTTIISSDTPISSTLSSSIPITSTTSFTTPITTITTSSSSPITSTTITTTPIISTTSSSITTIVDELPEGCQVSSALEQCAGAGEVWYLDLTRSECVLHINSDTGATCRTTGVFDSQEACERSCGVFRNIDVCRYAVEPGPCRNFVPKYYFDAKSQSCKVFRYGGCLGGPNRFSTLDECMQVCRPYIEPCKQYPEAGNCDMRNVMWYYDESRDQCGQFVYSGCGGNNNRFESQNECEGQCKRQHTPSISTTSASTTASSTTITTRAPSSTAAHDELPEGCQASPALEQCAGAGEVWYLDPTRSECVSHINSNTGASCRTTGVFDSQEDCERSCGVSSDVDPCKQYPEGGNCLSRYVMWYYDESRQQCGQFIYTGCGGNNNRFKSREDCEGQCRYPNNVQIKTTTSATVSVVTPQTEQVNEECRIPESLVPCGTNITVFYFDSNNKKCVESNIGGCRHANSYRTEEECERRCGAFRDINICEARLDPGPCRQSITKFYWDPASGICQQYAYGGCLGGPNRFSSIDECEEVCGSSGPAAACLQDVDTGALGPECGPTVRRWHYSAQLADCLVFVYQGCAGNQNNFVSYDQCADLCKIRRPDSNEVVPSNCDWYNDECSRLQCENGLVQTATADGCRRCSCKEVVDKCESARQECAALQCSYGVERFTENNGCVGCRCLEHPCATLSCSAEEHCVVKVSQDPDTQESKYSAVCEMESNEIVPDCERFDEECAQLRCNYAVQRTRTALGCERCSCVQIEVSCAPHQQDCETLRCTYGTEKYKDTDGCERCKCKKHPCDGVTCLPEERCVPNAYRDALTQETKFTTVCNVVNKPGTCPPEELASTESSCRQSCHDDADCRGVGKCCVRGCSRLCVVPASPTSPLPIMTTYALDVPHAPQSLPETEPEVTASEGGKATLRCLFHANPPPKITWTRGEIKIDGDEGRFRLLSDGALEIVSLYRNDSGVYICVADNGLGIARQEIRLQVNDPVKTPVGISGEQNAAITGEFGRSLVLRCLAYGYPQPSVFWYRGLTGPMVPYSSTLYEARGNVLRIKKITYETLGEYACQAYNGEGRPALWTITVRAYKPAGFLDNPYFIDRENGIEVPPREPDNEVSPVTTTSTTPEPDIAVFTVPVSTKLTAQYTTISAGTELSLPCEVDGYPDPDIHWTKDGVRLEPSTRISITGTSVSRLTVYSVTVADSGDYGCHAANQYSSHYSTAHITVQGLTIPAKCTDNKFFADCRLIVRSKFCKHKYYSKFCCKSCMEAGQLNSQDLEAQNDQSWSFRK